MLTIDPLTLCKKFTLFNTFVSSTGIGDQGFYFSMVHKHKKSQSSIAVFVLSLAQFLLSPFSRYQYQS